MSAVRAPEIASPLRRQRPTEDRARRRGRRLRVVPRGRARTRRWPLRAFAVLAVGGLLVAIVAMQALVNQTSFKMRDLQRQTRAARQASTQLRLQVADLSVPERIVRQAATLGLHLPDTRSVHVLQVREPKATASRSREVREGSFRLNGTIGERP